MWKLPKFMTRAGVDFSKESSAIEDVARMSAAAAFPTMPPPKPPRPGGASHAGYRKSTVASSAKIQKPVFDVANVDLTATYRSAADTPTQVRNLSRVSPELAGSLAANTRVGIPEKYIAIARDPDGTFNIEATRLALQLLRTMNTMPDYINGFSQVNSLRSTSEALSKEIQQTGAMALELVLDKQRLPLQWMPVPVSSIEFYEDGKGVKPIQKVGGDEVDLDIATFFWVTLDPSLYNIYPQSPMESAIQPTLASTTFLTTLRKLCERHVFKRYDIKIDEEKLRERIPAEIAAEGDDALAAYLNGIIDEVNNAITDLGVDEALVHFDFFEVKYIDGDTGDTPGTFETVRDIYDGKIATATKTPPSVLGMGSKSQNVASTETLMFLANANGMVRQKLQELYSKALTLSVRLMGMDVTVEFEFDDIELKPAGELEAYRAMRFERLTNLVSIGWMTDEEACLRLTGQLPQNGYTVKWDTMFKQPAPAAAADPNNPGNPASPTSAMGKKTPAAPKGPAKK
jgi:hypothetical protein